MSASITFWATTLHFWLIECAFYQHLVSFDCLFSSLQLSSLISWLDKIHLEGTCCCCIVIFLSASWSSSSKCWKIFILLLKLSSHKIMFIERGVGGREEGLRTPCPSRRVRRRGRPRPGGICRSWRCQPCSGPWAGWAESGSVSPDRPSQNPENNQIYDLSLSLSPQQRSDLIKLFKALQSRVQP